jgi:hypothetical protein
MSGPIKFMILAIVIGIETSPTICFVKGMDQDQSVAGLSVCYHWVTPPNIGVDGSDKLGGGVDPCGDCVAVVKAV